MAVDLVARHLFLEHGRLGTTERLLVVGELQLLEAQDIDDVATSDWKRSHDGGWTGSREDNLIDGGATIS